MSGKCPHTDRTWVDAHCYSTGDGYVLYDCNDCGKKRFKRYVDGKGKELKTAKVFFDKPPTDDDLKKAIVDAFGEDALKEPTKDE